MQWRATGATGSGAQAVDALFVKWRHAVKRVTFVPISRPRRENKYFSNSRRINAPRNLHRYLRPSLDYNYGPAIFTRLDVSAAARNELNKYSQGGIF